MTVDPERIQPANGVTWTHTEDSARADHSSLRYRMLRGTWGDDLELAIQAHVPAEVRRAWGPQDLASNVFKSIASDLGPTSYLSAPEVSGPDGSAELTTSEQSGILTQAGYWPLMQGVGEDLVGLREVGMRLEWDADEGLQAEPIPPHRLEVDVAPGARHPRRLAILDLREHPHSGYWWCWEEWDIRDPMSPGYRIVTGDRKSDVTSLYAARDGQPADSASLSGERYPWRWTQGERKGKPIIPVPVYHALRRGSFWDPWYGVEAVAGSLTLAVLNTFWVHCIRDGSIATILIVGGVPAGIRIQTADGQTVTASVPIAAGAMNIVNAQPGVANVQAMQLQPSANPLELIQAIQMFEQRVATYAGVSVSDLLRQSGDPRSGYALSISSEGRRNAARRFEPQLRAGDLSTLEISACLANVFGGRSLPETGYGLSYVALPLSPDELRARGEHVERMMRLGLMTRRDAVRSFHADWTDAQIASYLTAADSDRAMLSLTTQPK